MLEKMKKKYLSKVMFLWLFCAVLCAVTLLIDCIIHGKWLIGVLGALSIFAIAAVLICLGRLRFTKFERAVRSQEARYSVEFADDETEPLSSSGNVYLSKNWLINLPKWAFCKEYITKIEFEEFRSTKATNDKFCCFIHTVDLVNYTAWVANSEAVEKIEEWFSEK